MAGTCKACWIHAGDRHDGATGLIPRATPCPRGLPTLCPLPLVDVFPLSIEPSTELAFSVLATQTAN